MDAEFGEKLHSFYGPGVSDLMTMGKKSVEWDLNSKTVGKKGKKSMEWDLNDWGWDGDLFTAARRNSAPSECTSSQLFPVGSNIPVKNGALNNFSLGSDDVTLGDVTEKRDLEKRRRVAEVENEQVNEEERSLNLKLGGQVYPVTEKEEKSGKKTKVCGATSSCVVCQVDDCKADLSNAKDYHRRHKVCDVHSKTTRALVGNIMQRFCQQCSRFHALQEFDEGKRSCRRRLAGHNKRRRKTHPENAATLNDQQGINYLVISLIRILSNIQTNSSDQIKDQELLPHLLRNLANLAGTTNERNHGGPLPVSQDLQNVGTSPLTAVKDPTISRGPGLTVPASDWAQKRTVTDIVQGGVTDNASASLLSKNESNSNDVAALGTAVGKTKLNKIDLNSVYDSSQDCFEDLSNPYAPENLRNVSSVGPLWLDKDRQQSSPPQTSGNSGSTLSHSPSTSSGEAQSRTDRIVFKLFGKDPSHCPLALRKQILDWLSSSPTDIESYIRPGCIMLTIYLCMDKSTWEEYIHLTSSLTRLLESSNDLFWKSGWIYSRVGQRVTFVYNGQVFLETPLLLKDHQNCEISNIKPIAVSTSEDVKFVVNGFNLSPSASRLLCALEGKYLVQENCADMAGGAADVEHDEIQSLSFSCAIPNIVGRGFIEVEDHGLGSSFFPFIVAEKDVCYEIRTLESIIEAAEAANSGSNLFEDRNQALDFIHEMGWLLHKSRLKFRLEGHDMDLFSFKRFKWLIEFAIDHNWCAVVKKLLSIVFDGIVDAGQHTSILAALLDIYLLHRAVRNNCRPMVEFLLRYRPSGALDNSRPQHKQLDEGHYLFRPDSKGPGGLTPLHIAACLSSCQNVLDTLIEDPGSVGIEAWKNARDDTGLTPQDHASFSCHYSYIHLVQRKLDKKSGKGQVVIDIPGTMLDTSIKKHKIGNARMLSKLAAFQTEKSITSHCGQCEQKLEYGRIRGSIAIYRPAMVSMVAIAAVCVCAALLFKSSPEVFCSFRPFSWELLKYGAQ